ncbi:hypothetical protein QLH51_02610 [Sphingomonas sp. 2R-10]|uniref:hypothetical protein n=1 Tax=Sphingomonas sp. 2R-10 TaxID=3045148 RepID=UPI000F7ABEB1|nr:hypothetical protein [Sphingomonas sp. 2R-10]MDJ0275700.1 hypothetical protein [Sphingomonas sp. 2R-10]
MIVATLLLFAQTAAVPPAQPDEIIVTGHRAEDALVACLQRSCPPAEEVEASLQASVEQFTAGRYDHARRTLQAAIRRNRQHAAPLPGPVSSLYATLATVAEHEGDAELWQASSRNNVQILRRELGPTDPATLVEELGFADNMVATGSLNAAESMYAGVRRHAVESGQGDLAAGAAYRQAWLALARDRYAKAEQFATEAVALVGTQKPLLEQLRDILRARIAIRKGDAGAVDALAARLGQSVNDPPQLLFSRPVEDIQGGRAARGGVDTDPWHDSSIRFADVGYWIRPDGRTADVEVLRDAGLGQWRSGILKQVSDRRYVPLRTEPGNPGMYRIDRFTVRATKGVPTGTRIARRMGALTVHVIDLTETEAMSAAARERTRMAKQGS